jgi:hypothetical protein
MPSDGHASPSLAEFAPHERQGRVEPELGPSTMPRTANASVTSDSPVAAGLSGVVSEIDLEPRLFDFVPREAQLTSAPSRSAPTDRPHVGSVSYLLLFALIGAAIIGIFFGLAFAVLTPPKDHTVVAAGPVSSGEEEAVSTAKATPSPGDPAATIVTSAPVQDPTSHMPDSPASPPQVNSSAAAGLLQLIGEASDDQIATEAQRRSGVMQRPPRTPQLLCRPIDQSGNLAGFKLGQVPVSKSVVPDVDWTETGGRLARVLASRSVVEWRFHRFAGSAMRYTRPRSSLAEASVSPSFFFRVPEKTPRTV